MQKKYLSLFVIILTMAALYTGCDNTGATLTELWRIKGGQEEYISETYRFDTTGSMIVQGMKYDAEGNRINSLSKVSPAGQTQWSNTVPFSAWCEMEIDRGNNILLFSLDAGSGTRMIIMKYSPDGSLLWQKSDIGAENSYLMTTPRLLHCLDAAGNIFIMAKTGTLMNQYAIIKLNPNGSELWRHDVGMRSFQMIGDADGNIYIGTTAVATGTEAYTLRVLKFSGATGALLWDKVCLTDVVYGELYSSSPVRMLMDRANNLVIARNGRSAKLDKISPSGDFLWNYIFKPTDAGTVNVDTIEVRFDGNNNAIISTVVAVQTGMIPMPSTDMTIYWPLGYQYCRLIKVDTNGKKVWSKKVSNVMIVNGDTKGQLNVDRENNIYVFCNDNKLMKYTSAGKKLWTYEPEVTNVSMSQLSEWHVDSDMNLYWILQCGSLQNEDGSFYNGYWITKYSQE